MTETFYEVLGVEPDADSEAVEAAFRERAKEVHPDVSDHPDAAERFQRVRRAETVLADPVERRRYDRLGHEAYLRLADVASAGADAEEDSAGRDAGTVGAGTAGDPGPGRAAGTAGGAAAGAAGAANARAAGAGPGAAGTGGGATAGTVGRGARESATWRRARADYPDDWIPGPWGTPTVDRQEGMLLSVVMLLLHPIFLYSSVTPLFPLFVNLTVALFAVAATVYVVATPYVGVAVFGIQSLLLPVVLVATGQGLASPLGLVGVVGVWVPFGLSLAVAWLER